MNFNEQVRDDFTSWEEVRHELTLDWVTVGGAGCEFHSWPQGLQALERPGRWRAAQRRGLHRIGFRRVAHPLLPGAALWVWSAPPDLLAAEIASSQAHVDRTGAPVRPAPDPLQRMWTALATHRLAADAAVQALRDVFRTPLSDVVVTGNENWDEDDETVWDSDDDEDADADEDDMWCEPTVG